MILTILIKSIYAIADFALVPIVPRDQTSMNNNDSQSIKTEIKSDALGTCSQNGNYLKPFDPAFIAYQMMGLNDR
jgi:hypothetical protein